jgi:hypothetical protein
MRESLLKAVLVTDLTLQASLSCFAWMHSFFNAIGDKEPDRPEIHLDAQPMKQFYDEYQLMMESKSHVSIYFLLRFMTLTIYYTSHTWAIQIF